MSTALVNSNLLRARSGTRCEHSRATLEKQLVYTMLGIRSGTCVAPEVEEGGEGKGEAEGNPPRGRGGKQGPCPAAASIPQRGPPLWGTPPGLVGRLRRPSRGSPALSSYHFA